MCWLAVCVCVCSLCVSSSSVSQCDASHFHGSQVHTGNLLLLSGRRLSVRTSPLHQTFAAQMTSQKLFHTRVLSDSPAPLAGVEVHLNSASTCDVIHRKQQMKTPPCWSQTSPEKERLVRVGLIQRFYDNHSHQSGVSGSCRQDDTPVLNKIKLVIFSQWQAYLYSGGAFFLSHTLNRRKEKVFWYSIVIYILSWNM